MRVMMATILALMSLGVATTRTPEALQTPNPRTLAAAKAVAGCQPQPLPAYKAAAKLPQRGSSSGGGKSDSVDGAVAPRLGGVSESVVSAHDAALRALRTLTRAEPTWIDAYLRAESASPAGRSVDGRLFLRLDAIEQVVGSQQR